MTAPRQERLPEHPPVAETTLDSLPVWKGHYEKTTKALKALNAMPSEPVLLAHLQDAVRAEMQYLQTGGDQSGEAKRRLEYLGILLQSTEKISAAPVKKEKPGAPKKSPSKFSVPEQLGGAKTEKIIDDVFPRERVENAAMAGGAVAGISALLKIPGWIWAKINGETTQESLGSRVWTSVKRGLLAFGGYIGISWLLNRFGGKGMGVAAASGTPSGGKPAPSEQPQEKPVASQGAEKPRIYERVYVLGSTTDPPCIPEQKKFFAILGTKTPLSLQEIAEHMKLKTKENDVYVSICISDRSIGGLDTFNTSLVRELTEAGVHGTKIERLP
jgi:hypothetical protein